MTAAQSLTNFILQAEICQRLFDRKIIAQEEFDQRETQRTLALTDLEQIRVRYNHGFPRAPIAGIINHLHVDAGEYADVGKPIAEILNIDQIKINVQVPELDVRFVRIGQQTPVRIDAFPDRTLLGTVDYISFKADPATKTFLVRSLIANPAHEIRPGMIGRVAFVRRVIPDAVDAPLFALVDKGGERILFVENCASLQPRLDRLDRVDRECVRVLRVTVERV